MWSTLKKERFFPLDSCLLNSLSPTCSLLLEKTRKVPILAMLLWVAFQPSPIPGATVDYYFYFIFFCNGVSLHLQTKVLSGAQAGIRRCCFPWKPGGDKLHREMLFACAAVVARLAGMKSVFYGGCWASAGQEQPFLGWVILEIPNINSRLQVTPALSAGLHLSAFLTSSYIILMSLCFISPYIQKKNHTSPSPSPLLCFL